MGWRPDNSDAATWGHLEQTFVAQDAQRAQDGVAVDAQDGGDVTGWREAPAELCFAVGDGPADLHRDLLMQVSVVGPIKLDIQQCDTYNSTLW